MKTILHSELFKKKLFSFASFCNFFLPIVWSDDDWLKKFSGKTVEEAEAEAASGEATTTTQEVRGISLS